MDNDQQARSLSQVTPVIREDAAIVASRLGPLSDRLAGTTMLVTGGSGFLCSYVLDVVAHLNDTVLGNPCRMICLDNLQSGLATRLAHLANRPDFRFINRSIADPLDLEEPVHWILHGASIASPIVYRKFPLETIDANVGGTRRVLELARENPVQGMIAMSTSEIYGDPDPAAIPTSEDYRGFVSCTGPRSVYDESKRMMETLCGVYFTQFNVPVNTIRPFNVFGPGQRLDDGRIMPDLIGAALRGAPIVLYSDGRATRSFCYVRDAVHAMMLVLLGGPRGEPFNVGNDTEEIAMGQVVERLKAACDLRDLKVQQRASVDPHYTTDNPQRRAPNLAKLRGHFPGWRPEVSLDEGIARTLRSYRLLQESLNGGRA